MGARLIVQALAALPLPAQPQPEVGVTYAFRKVAQYALPDSLMPDGLLQLLATDYKFAVSFVILIVVLLFRPTGLFRGKSV